MDLDAYQQREKGSFSVFFPKSHLQPLFSLPALLAPLEGFD